VDELNKIAVDIEQRMFFDGCFRAWSAGSGPCTQCKTCDVSRPCLHAERMRPSMEACGIDVFSTARGAGLPIEVLTSHADERDFYALVLVD
jgi:predicted metal-binding protein